MAAETVSENRLRAFVGEMLSNPAPLELSYNSCTRCEYCFAALNGREKKGLTASATVRHIERVFRTGGNPRNFADQLLVQKFPIVYSNGVDPLAFPNLAPTRQTLPVLQALGVPVIFQTRGTDRVKDFPQYLDMLPAQSVLYCSLTTFDERAAKDAERGSPTNQERCEIMAMAAERGIPVVAALNPIDPEWVGDVEDYFDQIDRYAGRETVKGTWIEPLHLSDRQFAEVKARHPMGLPVLLEGPCERASASPFLYDRYFVEDVFAAVEERGWKRYSGCYKKANRGRADLFDLWPNPFPTHHALVEECLSFSEEEGGAPVLLSCSTFLSAIDRQLPGVLDAELSRGDVWFYINARNNVDKAERGVIPKDGLTLGEVIRFLWSHPETGNWSVWGAYGLRLLVSEVPDEGERVVSRILADDGLPYAVFTENEDIVRRAGKVEIVLDRDIKDDYVVLEPADEAEDDSATS